MIEYYNKKYSVKHVLMSTSVIVGQKIHMSADKISMKSLNEITSKFRINIDDLTTDDMMIYLFAERIKRIAIEKNKDADTDTVDALIGQIILATS